ncbi:MAG: sulfatase-like hydrolase/transferase [Pseudomonadota bacterium]
MGSPGRPAPANLLFFVSDNHNRALAGCYGHPNATTPNLDRIAARGVRFANAYSASPLCCPARAALATGRYPHQTGFFDNAIVYDGSVPSWMHRLRGQGHHVASIGKLHYRATEDDNGFSEELLAMHILDGKGGTQMLLRGFDDERVNPGQFELYMERSGIGTAPYQSFDVRITEAAETWLEEHGRGQEKPWALFVSYPSPHPPFRVPERLYRLHPEDEVPLPGHFRPDERAEHPALDHLRKIMATGEITDEALVRRIAAGYLGLIAHLDEQIGRVMAKLEALGLMENTRIMYTSDHGDLAGEHGLLGKCSMYEGSIGVPLLMCGPGVPAGGVSQQIASHTDLFPTIVEAVGAELAPEDDSLPGASLWPAIQGQDAQRTGFAEYHAVGSKTGVFMLREGDLKLVYYVGMPPQLFDLATDPDEVRDLVKDGSGLVQAKRLEAKLRAICDPEAVDAEAKASQRAWAEHWGGREAVAAEGFLVYTPPPGHDAEIER